MNENTSEIKRLRSAIRDEIEKDIEKHKEHSKFSYLIQFILMIVGSLIAWFLAAPSTVNTAQSRYTERKVDAYLEVTRRLRDGRNPHGMTPNSAVLPIYASVDSFTRWWRRVDDYYYENDILFDDSSSELYKSLNVEVLRQMSILNLNKALDSSATHDLKDSLVARIEPLLHWYSSYLDEKYGTEEGIRTKLLRTGLHK